MANWYVDTAGNGASDSNTGHGWGANAFLTVQKAISSAGSSDQIFLNHIISDSYATSQTFSFPCPVYSTDTTNAPPLPTDLVPGAEIATTGASNITLGTGGSWIEGIKFTVADSTNAGGFTTQLGFDATLTLRNCTINMRGTGSNTINVNQPGFANALTIFDNTTVVMNAGSQGIFTYGFFLWRNTPSAISASSAFPGNFISPSQLGDLTLDSVDFTGLPSGHALLASGSNPGNRWINNCKMPAGTSIVPVSGATFENYYWSRSDPAGGTVNNFGKSSNSGAENNNTSIFRAGGAADFSGNGFSKQLASAAGIVFGTTQLISLPMSQVNLLTGSSRTVTVYGIFDSASLPNNTDIWIEVTYPKDSGDTLGGFATSYPSQYSLLNQGAGSALASDSSTWNGIGGFSNPGGSKFKMTASFTPQLPGPITVRVCVAKPSTTYYVDGTFTVS